MTSPPPLERRTLRSRFTDEALGHWLAAVAARAGLRGIVVADDDGLLLGTAGRGSDWEELAALAASATLDGEGQGSVEFRGRAAAVRAMRFEGYPLRMCALGEAAAAQDALVEAAAGITRILGARA